METVVQVALDSPSLAESMVLAEAAVRAGCDWLEAGTPFIQAEGLHGIRELRSRFPRIPIVADLKTMDGGYIESVMAAQAGATHVVVMARAHVSTVRAAVRAGRDHGFQVLGDNLGCPDRIGAARMLADEGCDVVVHHIGLDEREAAAAATGERLSTLKQLREVATAVSIPVGAVGGLTVSEAVRTPEYGAAIVILATPLTVRPDDFALAEDNVETTIRQVCRQVHGSSR